MRGYKYQYSVDSSPCSAKNRKLTTDYPCPQPKGRRGLLTTYKTGFTLMEILLVTVILSIVGLSVYSAFNSGIKVWKRIVRNVIQEDISIFFEKISRDLRNSFQYADIKFEGTEERISFPTLIASQEQGILKYEIGRVTYSGDSSDNTINREQTNYSQLYQNINSLPRKLVNNVESLTFQYYYQDAETERYDWKFFWKDEKSLPLAVKVKVEFYENRNKNNLVETIYIPVCKILETSQAK